ncbi:MAG: TIGR01459 family HAD-type hydrolase, partial [Alphaproteobacteria bacterium]|nr:TIGR01459 family HAD-type hydrolase [Alphaproteobacteria bacterium]
VLKVRLIESLNEVADDFDGFLIDIWGVLHDGHQAYPAAPTALRNLRDSGKGVVLISNAPRPVSEVPPVLRRLGIGDDLYDGIMTSGQVVWQNLARRDDPWYRQIGEAIYLLGPMKDSKMVEGIIGRSVLSLAEAEVILATGVDYHECAEDYRAILVDAAARGLPMICANPDRIVIHKGQRLECAGMLAAIYESLGGVVRYHGKPYAEIYDLARGLLPAATRQRVAAIGDSFTTDMRGANNAGLTAIFVAGGIHAEYLASPLDLAQLKQTAARESVTIDLVMEQLSW